MIALTERQAAAAWAYALFVRAERFDRIADADRGRADAFAAFAWVPLRNDGVDRKTPTKCLRKAEQLYRSANRAAARAIELRGYLANAGVEPSARVAAAILGLRLRPAWEASARPMAAE